MHASFNKENALRGSIDRRNVLITGWLCYNRRAGFLLQSYKTWWNAVLWWRNKSQGRKGHGEVRERIAEHILVHTFSRSCMQLTPGTEKEREGTIDAFFLSSSRLLHARTRAHTHAAGAHTRTQHALRCIRETAQNEEKREKWLLQQGISREEMFFSRRS